MIIILLFFSLSITMCCSYAWIGLIIFVQQLRKRSLRKKQAKMRWANINMQIESWLLNWKFIQFLETIELINAL